jgi:hypothetical protein
MNLQEIKTYFEDRMVTFPEIASIDLTETQKMIFYTIGLPNYGGYGGHYKMLDKLDLIENRYLKFGTRENDEDTYFEYLDLKTGNIVFKFLDNEYNLLNTNLESYLVYVYIYMKFAKEVKWPQKFGAYYENKNYKKYAIELNRRFLEWNDDVKKGTWSGLIEEMSYGVI